MTGAPGPDRGTVSPLPAPPITPAPPCAAATAGRCVSAPEDRRDERVHLADPAPAAEVLGRRARTPQRDGLARTPARYRDHTEDAAAG
ncbi:MAG TPA: hypothetical protein VK935_03775 [Actinomycetospora sp.]|nr:hypothetical protein [Actinomycetospora sp.]